MQNCPFWAPTAGLRENVGVGPPATPGSECVHLISATILDPRFVATLCSFDICHLLSLRTFSVQVVFTHCQERSRAEESGACYGVTKFVNQGQNSFRENLSEKFFQRKWSTGAERSGHSR